ncbi:apolipoprotein N-acyltransferase [Saccharospirillum impatiens]|uniref:apolipoprotein N-acyltransferase n=1 Tax=Saccharospirillum impatiens TaxID=169438 RepID=UPI000414DBC4|nr:apolipoprotein N-acyltransferase [Saccharospirillum impatiens]
MKPTRPALHPLLPLVLVSLVSGTLLPLALAPFGFWPAAWLSLIGYFWVTERAGTGKQAFWLGWCYGAGLYGLGISWVYGSMRTVATPIPLSVLMTAAFCLAIALLPGLQAWLYHRYFKRARGSRWLAAPLLWLVFEWVRSWLFTGMPWLYAGYALTDTPAGQLAAVVSVYGLSTVIAFSAAGLAMGLPGQANQAQRRTPALSAGAILLAMGSGWLLPADRWSDISDSASVVAIQSNVSQAQKWQSSQVRPTLEFYSEQARRHDTADLMIWPEAALTVRPERIPAYLEDLDRVGNERQQGIITGIVTREDDRYFNALLGFGTADGEYRKQHLVPFGEYLPFEQQLRGLINFFNIPMSTLTPAPEPQSPMPWMYRGEERHLAPVICYEAAYPGLTMALARDSDLMIMVSNDAWFGDSLAPHQHLQITRMRAIENSRAIVRSTQNGISALIDANGEVQARSQQFEVAAVSGSVNLRQGMTPYQRWGGPYWALLPLLGLIALGWASRRHRG